MRTLGRLRYFAETRERRVGAAGGAAVGLWYLLAGLRFRDALTTAVPGELFDVVVAGPLSSGDPGPWLAALVPALAAGVAVAAVETTALAAPPGLRATPVARSLLAAVPVTTGLGVLLLGGGTLLVGAADAYATVGLFGLFQVLSIYGGVVVGDLFVVAAAVAVYGGLGCAAAGAGYAGVRAAAGWYASAVAESAG